MSGKCNISKSTSEDGREQRFGRLGLGKNLHRGPKLKCVDRAEDAFRAFARLEVRQNRGAARAKTCAKQRMGRKSPRFGNPA